MNRGLRREVATLIGAASAGLWAGRKKGPARFLAVGAAALYLWPTLAYSFRNRSVVITGSSRGLGFALAEAFLRQGARVALLARDAEELDRAQALLQSRVTGQVMTLSCDVTEPAEVKRAFEQIEGVFGGIDILINNAGAIVIGPLEAMDRGDFEALLELQVHAILDTTNVVLPIFQQRGGGRIANICSIGGKVPVPHMSSYCAAKFALAGLSSVMAAELAEKNVKVTTVFPGIMRVGSTVQAVVKGDHEKEYAWFALGSAVPAVSVSAERAAREVLAAIKAGDAQVVFPMTSKLAVFASANFPELFAFVLKKAAAFFPQGSSSRYQTGSQSTEWLQNQSWYGLVRSRLESAQEENNQQGKGEPRFNLGLQPQGEA